MDFLFLEGRKMRIDWSFFVMVGLAFGLLASLAYPVSPVPIVEPHLEGPRQDSHPSPLNGIPIPLPDETSSATDRCTIVSPSNGPLVRDSVLYGPHVTLNGTWEPLDVPGFPTLEIKQTCLEFLYTLEQEHYGTIVGPVLGGWHPDHNPREAYDYVWCEKGQAVYLEVEFGTWTAGEGSTLIHGPADDIDIFVWAPGMEHTNANSLTGFATPTGCNPEIGTFVAPVTGNYTIGLDYYSGVVPMGWRCYVYRYAVAGGTRFDGRSAVEDTAEIGFDGTFDVRLRLFTGTSLDEDDSWSTEVIPNVTFINFFPPTVTVDHPGTSPAEILGPGLVTINWTGSDLNLDETLYYTVEISNDVGETWKVIAYTTRSSTVWDPTSAFYGLPPSPLDGGLGTRLPNFLVRVNVTDGRFFASDVSDNPWILDDVMDGPFPLYEFFIILVVSTIVICLIIIDVAVFLYRRSKPKKKHSGDL
jgi:hypothetical protein